MKASKKQTAKRQVARAATAALRQKTGAPKPHFLSALALKAQSHAILIAGTRKERESLARATSDEITKQIWYSLIELAERVSRPKMTNRGLDDSARSLAAVASAAAHILRSLADSDDVEEKRMILAAASRHNRWPVLLNLGTKRNKEGQRALMGADKALDYLNEIELGNQTESIMQHLGDRKVSIFKKAAELLLTELHHWREHGALRGELTPWAKELLLLDWPMTAENCSLWWKVAKRWMDESWEASPQLFEPLISACSVKGTPLSKAGLYGAEKKSRIINLRLKEAFESLAKPADL